MTSITKRLAKTPYSVPAVERAIKVLRHLQQHRQASVTEVATALRIGTSSCFGILKTLQHHGIVTFDVQKKSYGLGLTLLELGGSVARDFVSQGAARPYVSEFVRQHALTCFIVARASTERLVVVDKEEPAGDLRISIAVGTRFRLTEGSSGRCFMAFTPIEERDKLLRTVGLVGIATPSKATLDAYRKELDHARKAGHVALTETRVAATCAFSAPVFDGEGRVLLAITAMGLAHPIDNKALVETGRKLRLAADKITAQLNGMIPS